MADASGIVGIVVIGFLVLGFAFMMFLLFKKAIDSRMKKGSEETKKEEKK
jgi:hypothetical protein